MQSREKHSRKSRNTLYRNPPNALALCCLLALAQSNPLLAQTQATDGQSASAGHGQAATVDYRIAGGPLDTALNQFSNQSKLQVVYSPDLVAGKRTEGLSGQLAPQEALRQLLQGSGLVWDAVSESMYVLKREASPAKGASKRGEAKAQDDRVVGMPSVMVKGTRTLNVDIERSIDDPQPYVIFNRLEIEKSGATSLDDFFRQRLPMNASSAASEVNGFASGGATSNINLRGLGGSQTLILVDGRRLGRTSIGSSPQQSDVNGIPMEAIERIEVLPGTASAIYGGSATGGVINIILRRDYVGHQVTLGYDNSFDTDSAIKRIGFSSGFSLLQGRTSVILNGSYTEGNDLLVRDRDFASRHYAIFRERNPGLYATTLPLGAGANLRSVDGSNLVMKNGVDLGASFTSAPTGYAGVASDGGAALLANAGQWNLDPSTSADWGVGGAFEVITPGHTIKYLSGSVRHDFSEKLQAFLDFSRSDGVSRRNSSRVSILTTIPASLATNPFQQDIQVRASSGSSLVGANWHQSITERFGGGLIYELPAGWIASADYMQTRAVTEIIDSSPVITRDRLWGNSIANGTEDLLADLNNKDWSPYMPMSFFSISPSEVISRNPAVRLSGPIGSLPGGVPRVSMLLERQDVRFGQSSGLYRLSETASQIALGGEVGGFRGSVFAGTSQKTDSAYVEFTVPLVSSLNEMAFVKALELQLSGRWDRYQTRTAPGVSYIPPQPAPQVSGYTVSNLQEFSPLAAIRYQPNDSLVLRASYSEGFLPPDVNQVGSPEEPREITFTYPDPRRGNSVETRTISYVGGGNPNLQPEYSKTWTAGLIYTPQWSQGLRISIDHMRLKKSNGLGVFNWYQLIADGYEEFLPGHVSRGPNLPSDPAGWAGPVTGVYVTNVNIASAILEAFDIRLDYTIPTERLGEFYLWGLATYTTKYDTQLTPDSPIVDRVDRYFSGLTLRLKGNLGVDWSLGPWTAGWSARYTDSYYPVSDPDLASNQAALELQGGNGRVPSQTYHDVYAKYDFSRKSYGQGAYAKFLAGMELQVGIRNVFNKKPEYEAMLAPYVAGWYSTFGDPRLATYYITLRQRF